MNIDGIEIAVDLPIAPARGLAFIVAGLKGTKDQPHIATLAQTALQRGFCVVRFNSRHTKGAALAKATISSLIEDLAIVIDWSMGQAWFRRPFILAGHSMGAIASLEYARAQQNLVSGLALTGACVSGALTLKALDEYKPGALEEWHRLGYKEEVDVDGYHVQLPWSHVEDRLRYDSLAYAHELTMPILLLVGSNDQTCPPEHQKLLFEHLKAKKELYVIGGASHTFREQAHLDEMAKIFGNWLTS
jgi:pimeloyl-ACP methyl ester carboxylesterase